MTHIIKNHYVLAVPDAQKTADFFVRCMGFENTPVDDPGWRFVSKDEILIMLGDCPGEMPPDELGDHSYPVYLSQNRVF